MSHDFRTALWVSMDLMAFVIPGEINTVATEHSERISQKLSTCDDVCDPVVVEFTVSDFLAAISGLEYARLYMDGIHKHFLTPIPQRMQDELHTYEGAIRAIRNDFLRRKREAGI